MKKILVVFTTAFVPTGGLTTVMMNYYRAMDKRGLQINFACTNIPPQTLMDELRENGSQYFLLPRRKNIIPYFIALKKLCKGYDIVHVHGNSSTSVLELQAAKWASVRKRIIHNHNSQTQHSFLNRILHPLFVRSYTFAIACSKEAGDWLFGTGEYRILRNAINVDKFPFDESAREKLRSQLGLTGCQVWGNVGKFVEAKNHKFLLELFATYAKINIKARLLLVGDGEMRQEIEEKIRKLGITNLVILAGLRSDIPDLLQAMDVFVFPSIYEGFPLSVIEAQASGLPCYISKNVTDKVGIGKDVRFLSLSDSFDKWIEAIESPKQELDRGVRHTLNQKLITQAGFNIHSEAKALINIYNR